MSKPDRHNLRAYSAAESLWGASFSVASAHFVLTLILKECGAGAAMIGAVAAIDLGALALPQLLGPFLFTSRQRRKRQLVRWFAVWLPAGFLLSGWVVYLKPALGNGVVSWSLLFLFAMVMCGFGIPYAVWTDWIAHVFPVRVRGRAMGLAYCGNAILVAAGLYGAGHLIGRFGSRSYPWLYWIAFGLQVCAITALSRVRDPAEHEEEVSLRVDVPTLRQRIRQSLSDPNFRSFLLARSLATAGFCFFPLIVVYFISEEGGGLPKGDVVRLGVISAGASALANYALGRLGDRKGHKMGMAIGIAAQIGALLAPLLMPTRAGCAITYACTGTWAASGLVSQRNILFETCPHDSRVTHIMIGNLILSFPSIAAALLAGQLAARWGLRPLMAGCLGISVAALALFLALVKEPRRFTVPVTEARRPAA